MKCPNLGYFVFYHHLDPKEWSLAPTVRAAVDFRRKAEELRAKKPAGEIGSESIQVRDGGYDLATFITFGVSDPASDHGSFCNTPEEAIRTVMTSDRPANGDGGKELPWPSRLMVVTLGAVTPVIDWPHLLGQYLHRATNDH